MIPDNWLLTENDSGIYQFLESAIIHTLHERRATYTSKHLSEMDLLNVEYNLIQAKRAYLRFTYKKKCCICDTPISDKVELFFYSILLFIRTPMSVIKHVSKKRKAPFAQSPSKTLKKPLNTDLILLYLSQSINIKIKVYKLNFIEGKSKYF